ncbi:MAG: hypothetical protein LBN19_01945 [Endomicrobium sp.]|nr:hypothetical protein [Endomicrobium sp.]
MKREKKRRVSDNLENAQEEIRRLNANKVRQRELQRQEIEKENNRLSQEIKMREDNIMFLSYYTDQQKKMIKLLSIAPSEKNTWTKIKKMVRSILNNVLFKRLALVRA